MSSKRKEEQIRMLMRRLNLTRGEAEGFYSQMREDLLKNPAGIKILNAVDNPPEWGKFLEFLGELILFIASLVRLFSSPSKKRKIEKDEESEKWIV